MRKEQLRKQQPRTGEVWPPAAWSMAARASGATNGFVLGTRSSSSVCAKKHTRRRHRMPSLHSCVLYLRSCMLTSLQLKPAYIN